jgi:hypothetical protein
VKKGNVTERINVINASCNYNVLPELKSAGLRYELFIIYPDYIFSLTKQTLIKPLQFKRRLSILLNTLHVHQQKCNGYLREEGSFIR